MELKLEIHSEAVIASLERYPEETRAGLREGIEEILTVIEDAQIKAYTKGDKPGLPAGSTYDRTFDLRDSSQRKIVTFTGSEFEAMWYTDLSYAPFVIGQLEDQAAIHRGRWKPLEEVKQEAEQKAGPILEKHLPKPR